MWISSLPDPNKISSAATPANFAENILFTQCVNEPYDYPEHNSSFALLSVLSGNGLFGLNGRKESIRQEQFLVVNSNSRLSIRITEEKTDPALLYFKTNLPKVVAASLSQSQENLLDDPSTEKDIVDFSLLEKTHRMDGSIRNKLFLLLELGGSSSSFATLKADIIVRSILEELIIKNNLSNVEALNLLVQKKSTRIELYKRLYAAKEWIDDSYHQPIELNDMARIACMNSQHFLRTFKQLFQTTPHQYLISVRLENAKKLLGNSSDTIQTICMNCGMESLSSFSWLFKRRFGVSPGSFRI
jgi:AraC family transcriptional regulator